MSDISIRKSGKAGWITLNRPAALNALTYPMIGQIETALDTWSDDSDVSVLLIDAVGERAFCSGGDISELYARGSTGDFAFGQQFWRDEYRMNAKLFSFPKPVVTFLQGFTMGGGVGVGCHASHRIVCDTSQVAMPEVGIGLVPDVGGSLILANAPGRLGEYLGTTASRMGPADAIFAGFADYYIPLDRWEDVKSELCASGDPSVVDAAMAEAPAGTLVQQQADIDQHFGGETLDDILRSLKAQTSDFSAESLKRLAKGSPLSVSCAVEMIHRLRGQSDIRKALELEYRFTFRAQEHADFLEGIRAAVIDKDRTPNWQHSLDAPPRAETVQMLMPLGSNKLTFEGTAT